MANYYCASRTNYFRVKDRGDFDAWAGKFGLEVCEHQESPEEEPMVCLLPGGYTDDGSFPSQDPDNPDEDLDFMGKLSEFLADGSVAILMESGAEKLRYVHGHAIAINSKGERIELGLQDIYEQAKRLGDEVTRAEY